MKKSVFLLFFLAVLSHRAGATDPMLDYTDNLGLNLIPYQYPTWHIPFNENMENMDNQTWLLKQEILYARGNATSID